MENKKIELPELMNFEEFKEYMHCKNNVGYDYMKKRNFPSFKIGGKWFVGKEDLAKWIQEQYKKPKFNNR